MKNLKTTRTLLISALSVFSLAVLLITLFFVAIRVKNDHALDAVLQARALEGKEELVLKNANDLRRYDLEIAKIRQALTRERDAILFAQKIETLGSFAGIDLSLESLEPAMPTKDTSALSFQIKARGTFYNLTRLLGMIENMPYRIDVVNAHIFRVFEEGSKENLWSLTLKGNVLSFVKE